MKKPLNAERARGFIVVSLGSGRLTHHEDVSIFINLTGQHKAMSAIPLNELLIAQAPRILNRPANSLRFKLDMLINLIRHCMDLQMECHLKLVRKVRQLNKEATASTFSSLTVYVDALNPERTRLLEACNPHLHVGMLPIQG